MGDRRKEHRGLVGKPEGKRPLGNVTVDLRVTLTFRHRASSI